MNEIPALPDPASAPTSRTVTVSFDLARLPGVGTALGVALLSSAIAVSAMLSREGDRLDGSTYTMGVLATLGLLGVAIGTHLLLPGFRGTNPRLRAIAIALLKVACTRRRVKPDTGRTLSL